VGPRAGLNGCENSRPHRDKIPRTVQPIASRYTDYAIPAQNYVIKKKLLMYDKHIKMNTYKWRLTKNVTYQY
jgi:hypothetical protein